MPLHVLNVPPVVPDPGSRVTPAGVDVGVGSDPEVPNRFTRARFRAPAGSGAASSHPQVVEVCPDVFEDTRAGRRVYVIGQASSGTMMSVPAGRSVGSAAVWDGRS